MNWVNKIRDSQSALNKIIEEIRDTASSGEIATPTDLYRWVYRLKNIYEGNREMLRDGTNSYELLAGEILDLSGLSEPDQQFIKHLLADAAIGKDYFDLLRRVKGLGAYPLRGGPITPEIAKSTLYRVAHDIADRVGIECGHVLKCDRSEC